MELYLSSHELGSEPEQLAQLFKDNKRVGLISNALDFSQDIERLKQSEEKQLAGLRSLGLQPESIDLRRYFGKPGDLMARLDHLGGVWARGGNTFVLTAAYQQSGLDQLLGKIIRTRPDFVYAGFSAGCCVLQESLEGLERVDDPSQVQVAYGQETAAPWRGLGLLDYAFVPHFDSDHPESTDIDNLINYYEKRRTVFRALRDGEVIVDQIKAEAND